MKRTFERLLTAATVALLAVLPSADAVAQMTVWLDGKAVYIQAVDTPDSAVFSFIAPTTEGKTSQAPDKQSVGGSTIAPAEAIDMGTSILWAPWNVGAKAPGEAGSYFAWGEVKSGKACYDWRNYWWMTKGAADWTHVDKYQAPDNQLDADWYDATGQFVGDGKTSLDATDDAVAVNWADNWRMPTQAELDELLSLQWQWFDEGEYSDGAEAGYLVTGQNGNSIFLPAAGCWSDSTVVGAGTLGHYWSSDLNTGVSGFAGNLSFFYGHQSTADNYSRHRGFSVRPVVASRGIKLNKSLLYKKWHINFNFEDNGESYVSTFNGPMTYYGTDESWESVSNSCRKAGGDYWHWTPVYAGNTDYGYMELHEDGTVNIHRRIVQDGEETYADETGTFSIDEENKTISLSIDVLAFGDFNSKTLNAQTDLRILSASDSTLQIAVLRDQLLSYNYVSDDVVKAAKHIKPVLYAVGGDNAGSWSTEYEGICPGDLALGKPVTRTITYSGSMNAAKAFALELTDLAAKFPNAFVRIDDIKTDGKSIAFKPSKFYYGDIDGSGTYRVELFSVYGLGTAKDSPFSDNASAESPLTSEPAVSAKSSVKITFTVFPNASVAGTYPVNFVTINPSWEGPWDYNAGQSVEVKYEGFKYSMDKTTLEFSYSDATKDFTAGSFMTFLEVANIYQYFPSLHATLDKIALDGTELTGWDASKVLDTNEVDKNYKLELWNCFGNTKNNCAFGKAEDGVMKELGFKEKMELTATFHSL